MIQVDFVEALFGTKSEVHAFLSEPSHGSGAQSGHTLFPLAGGALKSAGNWIGIQTQFLQD